MRIVIPGGASIGLHESSTSMTPDEPKFNLSSVPGIVAELASSFVELTCVFVVLDT
jgi:hypothetical protein